ncbi:type II toxin-antitoxin system HicB family antitoxin [Candidatus Uhrbacteria bacterium]|nr:type II toxin-antitoxin system HicB family antitoxin [Candidatus Uhrbacteria bacterium]
MVRTLRAFRVIIEGGEDGYLIARVPELPGCATQARTLEQLRRRVREAIALCLDVARTTRRVRHARHRRASSFFGVEDVAVRV